VSVLDDEYGRSTVAMAALVDKFAGLDLYDPERVKVSNYASCNVRSRNMCCTQAPVELQTLMRWCMLLCKATERLTACLLPKQVIAEIKKEGSSWVSKYARGGSARKQAARKMYIVVDALQG
jgi:hypothetical protein